MPAPETGAPFAGVPLAGAARVTGDWLAVAGFVAGVLDAEGLGGGVLTTGWLTAGGLVAVELLAGGVAVTDFVTCVDWAGGVITGWFETATVV